MTMQHEPGRNLTLCFYLRLISVINLSLWVSLAGAGLLQCHLVCSNTLLPQPPLSHQIKPHTVHVFMSMYMHAHVHLCDSEGLFWSVLYLLLKLDLSPSWPVFLCICAYAFVCTCYD